MPVSAPTRSRTAVASSTPAKTRSVATIAAVRSPSESTSACATSGSFTPCASAFRAAQHATGSPERRRDVDARDAGEEAQPVHASSAHVDLAADQPATLSPLLGTARSRGDGTHDEAAVRARPTGVGLAVGPVDEVDAADELARLDAVADVDERLPVPGVGREEVVVVVGRAHDHGRLQAERLTRVATSPASTPKWRRTLRRPSIAMRCVAGDDVPAAAELGRDDDLPLPLGLAHEQPGARDVDVDEVTSVFHASIAVDHLPPLLGVVDPVHLRPRPEEAERPPLCMSTTIVGLGDQVAR